MKSGKSENAHIILQLSCRFYEDIIVRNSWTPNGWEIEERERNLNEFSIPNPVVAGELCAVVSVKAIVNIEFNGFPGDNFKIYIFVGETQFHIAINDQPYCVYYHRLSIQLIRTIEVTKDIQSVNQIDHRSAYPSPIPSVQQDLGYVTFSNDVPRRFSPGLLM